MTIRFRIQAGAEPQCLPRLIDHFAQRGLIPSAISASHIGPVLEVIIDHPTIEEDAARRLCDRMMRAPCVESATIAMMR